MRLVHADYNMYHNSIDITTFEGIFWFMEHFNLFFEKVWYITTSISFGWSKRHEKSKNAVSRKTSAKRKPYSFPWPCHEIAIWLPLLLFFQLFFQYFTKYLFKLKMSAWAAGVSSAATAAGTSRTAAGFNMTCNNRCIDKTVFTSSDVEVMIPGIRSAVHCHLRLCLKHHGNDRSRSNSQWN